MAVTYGEASYSSDDGNVYNIRLNNYHYAAANIPPGVDGQPLYPHKWHYRCIHGKSATGLRASIPCDADDDRFVGVGTQFEVNGVAFDITGRSGEKRPKLAPAFA